MFNLLNMYIYMDGNGLYVWACFTLLLIVLSLNIIFAVFRKQRLFALIAILIGSLLATWLVTSALSENMNLFYSPTEIKVANLDNEMLVRAGGMVKEGSIIRDTDSLNVTFTVTDYQNELIIKYEGILPDLFDENAGVVVRGNLNTDGTFTAIEVLAKHDENYMPPEVAEMLIEEK